jgi:glutathione peroxidase
MTALGDFHATTIDGEDRALGDYVGEVVLVVNTASKCGFTPQYEGLQQLYTTYADQGFTVLGFPCDQFGHQEPGAEDEIAGFCQQNYGVSFPMFAKIDVNGADAHPLYEWLKDEKGGMLGGRIKWNFTKFLIGRDGTPIARYAPQKEPAELAGDIEAALGDSTDSAPAVGE